MRRFKLRRVIPKRSTIDICTHSDLIDWPPKDTSWDSNLCSLRIFGAFGLKRAPLIICGPRHMMKSAQGVKRDSQLCLLSTECDCLIFGSRTIMKIAETPLDTQNYACWAYLVILVWRYPQNCSPSEIFDFWSQEVDERRHAESRLLTQNTQNYAWWAYKWFWCGVFQHYSPNDILSDIFEFWA